MENTLVFIFLAICGLNLLATLSLLGLLFFPRHKDTREAMQKKATSSLLALLSSRGSITSPSRRATLRRAIKEITSD